MKSEQFTPQSVAGGFQPKADRVMCDEARCSRVGQLDANEAIQRQRAGEIGRI